MKKIILWAALIFVTLTTAAQTTHTTTRSHSSATTLQKRTTTHPRIHLGGEMELWHNGDTKITTLLFSPEMGYALSEKWEIGAQFHFLHGDYQRKRFNAIGLSPYVRHNAIHWKRVEVFVEAGVSFLTGKVKGGTGESAIAIGLRPGLEVNLSKNISCIGKFGFLGYRHSDESLAGMLGEDGYGITINTERLSLGFHYKF